MGVPLNALNDTATRTTQASSREISIDLIANGGLFGVDNKGATTTGSVQFAIQYKPTGSGTWLDLGGATGITFTGGMKSMGGNLV